MVSPKLVIRPNAEPSTSAFEGCYRSREGCYICGALALQPHAHPAPARRRLRARAPSRTDATDEASRDLLEPQPLGSGGRKTAGEWPLWITVC